MRHNQNLSLGHVNEKHRRAYDLIAGPYGEKSMPKVVSENQQLLEHRRKKTVTVNQVVSRCPVLSNTRDAEDLNAEYWFDSSRAKQSI